MSYENTERKIPSAADITERKADKILREAEAVIREQNIEKAPQFVEERSALGSYSALQYASAFMKMKLGDEIEDIKPERSPLEWMTQGRKGRNGGTGRDKSGRSGAGRDRLGRGGADKEKSDRSRFDRDGGRRNRTDGRGSDRDRSDKGRGGRGYDRA